MKNNITHEVFSRVGIFYLLFIFLPSFVCLCFKLFFFYTKWKRTTSLVQSWVELFVFPICFSAKWHFYNRSGKRTLIASKSKIFLLHVSPWFAWFDKSWEFVISCRLLEHEPPHCLSEAEVNITLVSHFWYKEMEIDNKQYVQDFSYSGRCFLTGL